MFCAKCGKEINDRANFCQYCGTSIKLTDNELDDVKGSSFAQEKKADILKLKKCLEHFGEIRDVYEKYSEHWNIKRELDSLDGCTFFLGVIVCGAILSFLGTLLFSIFVYNLPSSVGLFLTLALPFVFWFLGVIHRKKKKAYIQNQLEDIYKIIEQHYQKYEDCPLAIGNTSPSRIEEYINLIETGRADSIKEAINLQIDDEHKTKMLRLQQEAADNARAAASAAANAEAKAAKSLRAAKAAGAKASEAEQRSWINNRPWG